MSVKLKFLGRSVFSMLLITALFAGTYSVAEESEQDPQAVIQHLSDQLVLLIEENRDSFTEDPDVFHQQLKELMEPVVAFSYISKNVMGATYFKQADKQQVSRFEENFKNGLVKTYAKGFFSYNGEDIIVHEPDQDFTQNRKVTVVQEIKTEGGVEIAYTMGKNKQGQWKLLNMIVNGVNLGQILRNQFQQAMEQTQNLDQVIDEWATEEKKVDA